MSASALGYTNKDIIEMLISYLPKILFAATFGNLIKHNIRKFFPWLEFWFIWHSCQGLILNFCIKKNNVANFTHWGFFLVNFNKIYYLCIGFMESENIKFMNVHDLQNICHRYNFVILFSYITDWIWTLEGSMDNI